MNCHTQEAIGPLFDKAEANARAYMQLSPEERERVKQQKALDAHNQVFLHLQYHPNDPQSRDIQRIWREQVLQPESETPLPDMDNITGDMVGIDKLVVAYSRPLNLKNRFSVRDINGRGKSVSEHLAQWSWLSPFFGMQGRRTASPASAFQKNYIIGSVIG